jgi:hypothetical protein
VQAGNQPLFVRLGFKTTEQQFDEISSFLEEVEEGRFPYFFSTAKVLSTNECCGSV